MRQRDDWHLTDVVGHENGRGDPFAAAMRATRMPMIICDPKLPDTPIIFANESFQELTGYTLDEVMGRNCRFLQGPRTDPTEVTRLRRAIAHGKPINLDLLNYRKDGTAFWNALYVSPVMSEDDKIQYFVASQLDVTERVEAQRLIAEQKAIVEAEVRARTSDLEAALEAKTTLLHEVDHRVKNNLMMIGSLLRLQSRALPDPSLRATLENMLQRVDALASVHRRLYQSDDIEHFDLGAFAKTLVTELIGASGRRDIVLTTDIDTVEIPASKASAIGLILNEIITNALKHAYSNDRSGLLDLQVHCNEGAACIAVHDDGPGFDATIHHSDSIGRLLVERLSRQAKATTVWSGDTGGTHVCIRFPL